jgi:RNA polymerase sigma-70 factor (ECF subfamily)
LVTAFVEASAATKIARRISIRRDVITRDACERKSWCEDANVTEQTLARARAGDEDAFRDLTDRYRRELQLHIYRIVGSTQDAEDLLQETLLAAWRGLDRFEERASVRAWLHRIATNRSLDALRASRRRPEEERMTLMPEPTRFSEPVWLEPYPDVLLEGIPDGAPGPEARYETKEAIALAFIVGLQHLPPQQRAVLVLRDVLGYRAAEVGEMLQTSEASIHSLLRRARAAFESRLPVTERERAPLPNSRLERDIVGRFAETVENGDIDAMVALLTDDAWVTMPPLPHAYQGHKAITAFLRGSAARRGAPLWLVATRANGQPAFGCYLPVPETDIARAYALFVLTLERDQIAAITWFADSSTFPQFGLPRTLRRPER